MQELNILYQQNSLPILKSHHQHPQASANHQTIWEGSQNAKILYVKTVIGINMFVKDVVYGQQESLGGNVLDAIFVELPPVNLPIIVRIHLDEELFEILLHHLLIEKLMLFHFLSHPVLEFLSVQHIAPVLIVLEEDVLNKSFAVRIHDQINIAIKQIKHSNRQINNIAIDHQYMPPIPPIPPMPPMPPYMPLGFSSFFSTIMHSVVVMYELTEAASYKATLTTLAGSIIPLAIKSTNSPLLASNPKLVLVLERTRSIVVIPSKPALSEMVLQGRLIAFLMILIPRSCSLFSPLRVSRTRPAQSRAHPPPTTIPYSMAALVAQIAS